MKSGWRRHKLADLLIRSGETAQPAADTEYKEITIRLWGKGVIERGRISGSAVNGRRFIARKNQFIASRIDARNGAMGVVPEFLDGALVTNDFPLFEVNQELLEPQYMGWLCRTPAFVDLCAHASEGTTNRVRLKENEFLQLEIQIPDTKEQKKIVARIDTVHKQLDAADRLRKSATNELHALCRALVINDPGTKQMAVAELVQQRPTDVNVEPDVNYQFAGVYSFGRGVFKGGVKAGTEFAYPKLTRIKAGDFIYPKLMAWEGALGVVPDKCDGCVVSPEFPVFEIDQTKVLPDVFDVYFGDPRTWESLQGGSTGTNARRRRLNPADFLKLKIPVPGMATQRKLAAIRLHQSQIQSINTEAESSVVLAALLNKLLSQ
ncbi:restriction endonuclease subunit S [Rhodoferax sp.]|uniref:restriction endonuclease subunit S n=1 Tax=Rhodoferax sp. TaxID=50421 RepID=UPI00374DCA41